MYVGPGRCGDNVIGHLRQRRRRYTILCYALFYFAKLQSIPVLGSSSVKICTMCADLFLQCSCSVRVQSIGFQYAAAAGLFLCNVNSVKETVNRVQSEHSAK